MGGRLLRTAPAQHDYWLLIRTLSRLEELLHLHEV
jgi:hypothetical protein